MFELSLPWWELVVRALVIHCGLIILFRVGGKRQLGKMSPFGALISASVLLSFSYLVDSASFRFKALDKLIEGEPQVIVLRGEIIESVRTKEKITVGELEEAFRQQKINKIVDCELAVLEANGKVSAFKKSEV